VSTFTENRIRLRAQRKTGTSRVAKSVLTEELATAKTKTSFDIFLSHSTSDAEIILGVKAVLEDYGQTVYVDWVEDPQLNRANLTAANAEVIRLRCANASRSFTCILQILALQNGCLGNWGITNCGSTRAV
jgi:hypothetical protein